MSLLLQTKPGVSGHGSGTGSGTNSGMGLNTTTEVNWLRGTQKVKWNVYHGMGSSEVDCHRLSSSEANCHALSSNGVSRYGTGSLAGAQ